MFCLLPAAETTAVAPSAWAAVAYLVVCGPLHERLQLRRAGILMLRFRAIHSQIRCIDGFLQFIWPARSSSRAPSTPGDSQVQCEVIWSELHTESSLKTDCEASWSERHTESSRRGLGERPDGPDDGDGLLPPAVRLLGSLPPAQPAGSSKVRCFTSLHSSLPR